MNIERFIPAMPPEGCGLRKRVEHFLGRKEPPRLYDFSNEVLNERGDRKITTNGWMSSRSLGLGVSLMVKGGSNWFELMRVLLHKRQGEPIVDTVEVEVLTRSGIHFLDYYPSQGGKKMKSELKYYDGLPEGALQAGLLGEEDLPEYLDCEKTAEEFLERMAALDFSNPTVYPKA